MGMVICVAFNNQNWVGKCTKADLDRRLYKCQKGVYDVRHKTDEDGNCISQQCWEQHLCTKFQWQNVKNNFDEVRATGPVFFVFRDLDNSFVLWGRSKVRSVDGRFIYFDKFEPLPEDKWVKGLRPEDIPGKGKDWFHMGRYRYLSPAQEQYLDNRLVGES